MDGYRLLDPVAHRGRECIWITNNGRRLECNAGFATATVHESESHAWSDVRSQREGPHGRRLKLYMFERNWWRDWKDIMFGWKSFMNSTVTSIASTDRGLYIPYSCLWIDILKHKPPQYSSHLYERCTKYGNWDAKWYTS